MRVVFMGTPAFAVPSLEALAGAHDVALVVTRPDAAGGRGGALRPSDVKVAATKRGIEVYQPETLRGSGADRVRAAAPDVICVAAFGMLLPREVLEIPAHGCINVHASLLPLYRGAAPIQRAILAGERLTGISIMRMEEGLDTGPYALQRTVSIDDRYAADIENELAHTGAEALLEVLERLGADDLHWTAQDDSRATYAAKITKDDVALLPELTTAAAFARVRAATRRAPARACVGDRELTVTRAHPAETAVAPGGVCLVDGVPVLGFTDGGLSLDVVKPSGKGDMPGRDWARGARMAEGTCWRCTR